jgi:hypothetical protein
MTRLYIIKAARIAAAMTAMIISARLLGRESHKNFTVAKAAEMSAFKGGADIL